MTSILVIDDDRDLLGLFSRVLERVGHRVCIAENGKDGLRIFDEEAPDLVLTDLVMPGMDGHEVARHVRLSKHGQIPVVGMSGTPWKTCHQHFDDVLVKPFKIEELVETINRLIVEVPQNCLNA